MDKNKHIDITALMAELIVVGAVISKYLHSYISYYDDGYANSKSVPLMYEISKKLDELMIKITQWVESLCNPVEDKEVDGYYTIELCCHKIEYTFHGIDMKLSKEGIEFIKKQLCDNHKMGAITIKVNDTPFYGYWYIVD